MADVQRDISLVKTIQILDGSSYSQQIRKVGSYKNYLSTCMALAYNPYDVVRDAHLEYLRAGATVIRTNTFAAAFPVLRKELDIDVTDYNAVIRQSVEAARDAIDNYVAETKIDKNKYWVLGSCGSATRCKDLSLENITLEQCKNYHRDRIRNFIESKVDGLAFESIETKAEMFALIKLLQEFPTARAYISFRCQNGNKLLDGTEVQGLIRNCYQFLSYKIFAVGVNCILPEDVKPIIQGINQDLKQTETKVPLVVCPRNYSTPKDASSWNPMNSEITYPALEWSKLGVRFIGGCCNTLPEHIAKIKTEINKYNKIAHM